MANLPYAFSVHHFISTVGADAGFASIVGLAVLVLLFFAQARETTTLRDQLAEAGERVQALEARLSQATRAPGAAPVPAAQAAAAPARSATATARAAAPAPAPPSGVLQPVGAVTRPGAAGTAAGLPPGVGAPAQGAATRLIPDLTTVQPPVTAAATAAAAAQRAPDPTPAPVPAPTGGNGSGTPPPAEPPPRIQIRPGTPAAAAARRPAAAPRLASSAPATPSPRARRVLTALLALAGVAAIVVVLLVLTSGGSSNHTTATGAASNSNAPVVHRHRRTGSTTTVLPASVTVAVLNGTATNGLAHRVAVKLTSGGFKQGNVTTAVDQTRTATTVAYLAGQRRAALAVASTLKLGSASVAPADQTTRTVACQGLAAAACSAQTVIVTVGSDLANIQ